MKLPDNMITTITMVRNTQEKAVKLWEELVEAWFKFEWKGIFSNKKDRIIFKTWYDETLEREFMRQVEFNEIEEVKPKRKKRISPKQEKIRKKK